MEFRFTKKKSLTLLEMCFVFSHILFYMGSVGYLENMGSHAA